MIKAVFFDIDGTLVPFKSHSVPESTRNAISTIRKKGIKVFICTGRPIQFIDNLEGVEYDGMVTVTGALCIDAEGNVIGSCLDNINNLDANGTWKFKAICTENPDQIDHYELKEITGY